MQTCCGCGKELDSDRANFDLYAMCEACLAEAKEFEQEHTAVLASIDPRDYFQTADAATVERTRRALALARATLNESLEANREAEANFDLAFAFFQVKSRSTSLVAAAMTLGAARQKLASARVNLTIAYRDWSDADPYESYMDLMGSLTGNA